MTEVFAACALQSEQQFTEKWNFDVTDECPVPGPWTYNRASQQ